MASKYLFHAPFYSSFFVFDAIEARVLTVHNDQLWNDETSRTFFQDEYPWFLPVYDQLPEKVQKVDILKYFLMRHYGGIYIDLDNVCMRSANVKLKPLT